MDASSTTFVQAICGKKYRRASWTCFILNSFNQLSGINAINVYANRLLVQMEEEGDGTFPITPLTGTYIIGLSNAIPAIMQIGMITWLGRKTYYLLGEFFMAVFMTLCGVCVLHGYNMASFVTLCLFVASFQLSQGSVAWLYIPEVCVDAASGFAAGAQFLNLIVISFTFEFMINSPLKVYGSLWIFAGFSALGVLFVIF